MNRIKLLFKYGLYIKVKRPVSPKIFSCSCYRESVLCIHSFRQWMLELEALFYVYDFDIRWTDNVVIFFTRDTLDIAIPLHANMYRAMNSTILELSPMVMYQVMKYFLEEPDRLFKPMETRVSDTPSIPGLLAFAKLGLNVYEQVYGSYRKIGNSLVYIYDKQEHPVFRRACEYLMRHLPIRECSTCIRITESPNKYITEMRKQHAYLTSMCPIKTHE